MSTGAPCCAGALARLVRTGAALLCVTACAHPGSRPASLPPPSPAPSEATTPAPPQPPAEVPAPQAETQATPPQSSAAASARQAGAAPKASNPRSTPALPHTPAATAPSPAPAASSPALDLKALEQRLRDTSAIGVFTKLTLKNQVDDLLAQFKAFHQGDPRYTLAQLRQKYEELLLKVVSLLQDGDPALASAISASREAIWTVLTDPKKFANI